MCWRGGAGAVQRALQGGEGHALSAHLLHRPLAEGVQREDQSKSSYISQKFECQSVNVETAAILNTKQLLKLDIFFNDREKYIFSLSYKFFLFSLV